MSSITNFIFLGAVNYNGVGEAVFSFKGPSGAWAYQLNITDGSGYNYTVTSTYAANEGTSFVSLENQGQIFSFGPTFTFGTNYTATLKYSTTLPPGPFTFTSTGQAQLNFSLAVNTAGIRKQNTTAQGGDYYDLTFMLSSLPLVNVPGCSITCTSAAGYNKTQTFTTNDLGSDVYRAFNITGQPPGTLYTVTVNVPGLSSITRTYFSGVGNNIFGTPTIGQTSVTLPWTDGTGSSTAGSNCYTTCALYNEDTESWVATKTVAVGTQIVTFNSGLTAATSYDLYCWPVNAGGFAGEAPPGGDHSIQFKTGGVAAVGSWGIGSFYSPPSN
jgi:hypothetical protein